MHIIYPYGVYFIPHIPSKERLKEINTELKGMIEQLECDYP